MVMIQETKISTFNPAVCSKIWPADVFSFAQSESSGRSGGLLTIWDSAKFRVSTSILKKNYVSVTGSWVSSNSPCTFINVYGPSSTADKKELWVELSSLLQSLDHAICIGGDFNAVLDPSERRFSSSVSHSLEMDDFRTFVSSNGLIDTPLSNRNFTWHSPDSTKTSRLDRFLFNPMMASLLGNCSQFAIQRSISDHCAVVLKRASGNWGPAPFRAINAWTSHHDFLNTVKDLWSSCSVSGWKGFVVKEKIKALRKGLQEWNNASFGDINSKISDVLSSIQSSDLKAEAQFLSEDEIKLKKDDFIVLWSLLKQRERVECQKARVKRIKYGDCNSKYFHNKMKFRQRKNFIPGLQSDGSWIDEPSSVKELIKNHFMERFAESIPDRPSFHNLKFKTITEVQNQILTEIFTLEEIRAAVKECGSDKAPGPDGFSFEIIKHIWEIVEEDIVNFIMEFHHNSRLVKGLNASFIVLVPKVSSPTTLEDYRPISLIGCLYKILSKLLANRLHRVIGSVVSSTQSAFLAGRQILDGVLILNETIHDLKSNNRSGFFLKADFSKAFDCVSWSYLEKVQKAMGFCQRWRSWIQCCLSSSSISVLVNGSSTDNFSTSRGLRQGDPLSPFLFLLVAEGFNALMEAAIVHKLFVGVRIGTGNFRISHLQYADDTVILGENTWQNIRAAKFLLKWYELISGLSINFKKSKLFHVNCTTSWISSAASHLNCKVDKLPTSYLGLPVGASPRNYSFWKPVILRVEKKLCAWKSRLLSVGARLTLVNSVLTSLPLFYCSLFKMPTVVVNKLNSLIRAFFWGQSGNVKKTKWISWEKICLHKSKGGLGIPNLKNRNLALLAKWWDRFCLASSDELWKRVLIEKYYTNSSHLSPLLEVTNSVSKYWKDILSIGDVQISQPQVSSFASCFKWNLGLGDKIRFWHDNWASELPLKFLFPRLFALTVNKDCSVAAMGSFLGHSQDSWRWNIATISSPRGRSHTELLELLSLLDSKSPSFSKDAFCWYITTSFSVNEFYGLLSPQGSILPSDVIDIIWLKFSPPRVKVFVWKIAHDVLPIKWNMLCRGIYPPDFDPMCPLCNSELENQNHLFLHCPCVTPIWSKIFKWWGLLMTVPASLINFLQQCQSVSSSPRINSLFKVVCICALWAIWYGRNNYVFNNGDWDPDNLFHFIQSRSYAWIRYSASETHFNPSDWFLFPIEVAELF